ncbi:MAG: MATE family efflux transporter [Candidatus Thermoplasmatota archaeon]
MDKDKFKIFRWIISIIKSIIQKPGEIVRGMREEGVYAFLKDRMSKPGKNEILEGNVFAVMFKLGWPMMVATFLRTLYNLIDTFWLGNIPDPAVAEYSVTAVGQGWTVVFMMMSVQMGLGIAALALISQYTGQKNYEEADRTAGQLYFIAIATSLLIGIVGYFLTPTFMNILTGGEEELAYYGTQYIQIIFLGLPFMFLFFAFMYTLRGWGDTITPMKITAYSVSLNMIINPILIFGSGTVIGLGPLNVTIPTIFGYSIPRLGVRGAAIGTVMSRGVGSLYATYLLFSGKVGLKLKLSYLKPNISRLKKFLDIGIPAGIGRFGTSIGFVILWAIIYRLPNPEVAGAAYSIGNRILNITFLIMGGFAMAISTMVGQSLGADDMERSEEIAQKGFLAVAGLMLVFTVLLFALRNNLIMIFIPESPEVIAEGASFLMIFSLAMPFFGVFRGVTSLLSGSGHTRLQMGLSLVRLWGLRLPLVFLFAIYLSMNSTGVWVGMALSNVIAFGMALGVYKTGWWKEKVIKDKPTTKPDQRLDEEKPRRERTDEE